MTDSPTTTDTADVALILSLLLGALVGASLVNLVSGNTAVGLGGLGVAAALVPLLLRARSSRVGA